jgi:hypothetical protein
MMGVFRVAKKVSSSWGHRPRPPSPRPCHPQRGRLCPCILPMIRPALLATRPHRHGVRRSATSDLKPLPTIPVQEEEEGTLAQNRDRTGHKIIRYRFLTIRTHSSHNPHSQHSHSSHSQHSYSSHSHHPPPRYDSPTSAAIGMFNSTLPVLNFSMRYEPDPLLAVIHHHHHAAGGHHNSSASRS